MDKQVRILHLSDLHLGRGELRAEDMKMNIPEAERRRIIDRLGDYLRALPQRPDLVCVTGDLTNRGDPAGFQDFLTWVKPLIDEGAFPPPQRFLVTPGNHDVKRRAADERERFAAFYEVARAFPHAYVPGHDPCLGKPATIDGSSKLIGGMQTQEQYGKIVVVRSDPFLYDREARLLVFAFNSSLACGVYPRESAAILSEIDDAIGLASEDSALKRKLTQLRARSATDLLIDAGLVGDEQLSYFKELMKKARDGLGAEWARVTKVALLHHHVNPIWRQQLELKPFESIIDAAQLKQVLTEFGFDVVLHGHKHQNAVSLDAAVVASSDGRSPDPIGIVSGGTVCGHPALNDHQTFKMLIVDRSGVRESAVVEEYPLGDAGDPAEAMRTERRVYRLPLVNRIPEAHDDASLKDLLDAKLLEEAIPGDPIPTSRMDGGDTTLRGDTDLVDEQARYRFASVIDTGRERIFFDVFIATSRLDFRQRARIHWMLVDVKQFGIASSMSARVRLLIGNLAATHFSRERASGEIAASIKELRECFAPALTSGLLEIVERRLTQDEIDGLDQTIPAASRRS